MDDERLSRIERRVDAIWNLLLGICAAVFAVAVVGLALAIASGAFADEPDDDLNQLERCLIGDEDAC